MFLSLNMDNIRGEWYEVTGLMPGPNTFECNDPVSETCTYNQSSTSGNQIKAWVFEVTGDLEPIEQ